MSMDIRTSTDKRVVPNGVLVRLREEFGWGRPRLAKQFELVGRRHGISTPEAAAMEKQIYRLETTDHRAAARNVTAPHDARRRSAD